MKKNIFIVGQSIEKTTINLNQKSLIKDENQKKWLDLCLDNQFLKINSVKTNFFDLDLFKKILRTLNYNVFNYSDNQSTQQVELVSDFDTKTLQVTKHNDYLWQTPEFLTDYVVLLSSANLSKNSLHELNNFLKENKQTKLIVEYNSLLKNTEIGKKILKKADLIFVDAKDLSKKSCLAITKRHKSNNLLAVIQENNFYLAQEMVYSFSSPREYKLRILVWLAIVIKTLDFELELNQKIDLIDKIGGYINKLEVPDINELVKKIEKNSPNINLVGGEITQEQTLKNIKDFILNRAFLDLTNIQYYTEKQFKKPKIVDLIAINNLLRTHGLNNQISAINLSEKQYQMFIKSNNHLIGSLIDNNILFTIRMDQEKQQLKGFGTETISEGFENIINRLKLLKNNGIKAVNWQVDFVISAFSPSNPIVISNVHNVARFCRMAQDIGVLPIIRINFITKLKEDFSYENALEKQSTIFRSLLTEMDLMKVNFDQLIIETNLLANKGLYFDIKNIDKSIKNLMNIPTINKKISLIINTDNIRSDLLTDFNNKIKKVNQIETVSLASQVFEEIIKNWQYPENNSEQAKLRIKFSQILDQIK